MLKRFGALQRPLDGAVTHGFDRRPDVARGTDEDAAAMSLDDRASNRQPEPEALALRGEERLEQLLERGFGNPAAVSPVENPNPLLPESPT